MGKLQKAICKDFTVVHNEFLRDERLGIEDIGMLIKMLSLPDDWNFSIAGLAAILPNGKHKIMTALNNLKKYGYFRRIRDIDEQTGRVIDWIYEFSDQIHTEWIADAEKEKEIPHSDLPHQDEPHLENEPQSNTYISNINKYMIDGNDDGDCKKENEYEIDKQEQAVKEQISYDILVDERNCDVYQVDEIVDIIADVYLLSDSEKIKINNTNILAERIKRQFCKISYENIDYVLSNMKKCNKHITNMRSYLLSSLYNSSLTINNHIASHAYVDRNQGKW